MRSMYIRFALRILLGQLFVKPCLPRPEVVNPLQPIRGEPCFPGIKQVMICKLAATNATVIPLRLNSSLLDEGSGKDLEAISSRHASSRRHR